MTNISKFNENVKPIDLKMVSLKSTWENKDIKNKYQMKFGDIFVTTNKDGEKEYYLYFDISTAYDVTDCIKIYLEDNNLTELEDYDFLHDWKEGYWFYESSGESFDTELDENGLNIYKGIEGYKAIKENLVNAQLIYINDESTKGEFIEEWKLKEIKDSYNDYSYGKLGEETNVKGVFVGDCYELYVPDDHRDTFYVIKKDGKYVFSSYGLYDQKIEEPFEDYKQSVKEALEDGDDESLLEIYKPKKVQSYENFTEIQTCWIGDDVYLA